MSAYSAKTYCFKGAVTASTNFIDTLKNLIGRKIKIISFSMIVDKEVIISLGSNSKIMSMNAGGKNIVNIPPNTSETGIDILEMIFDQDCVIESFNCFYN